MIMLNVIRYVQFSPNVSLVRTLNWTKFHLAKRGNCLSPPPLLKIANLRLFSTAKSQLKAKRVPTREIKRLFGLAKDEKWRLTGAIILLTVSSSVTMAVPFCFGKVVDIIYSTDAEAVKSKLSSLALILVLVFSLGALANAGRVFLMNTTGNRITQKIRSMVFASVMKQEIGFFDRNKTGELINRLSVDTSLVGNSLSINISDGLRAAISIVAGISMMFYTSPQLALVGLATVPPVAGLTVIYGKYIRKLSVKVQDGLAGSTQLSEERFANIRTVRAFAKERNECAAYDSQLQSLFELMKKEAVARAIFFGTTGFCGNVIVLSVLYYGGLMFTDSLITIGDLSAFLMYAGYVGISFGGISSAYSEVMKGVGASKRFWEIVERPPTIPLDAGIVPTNPLIGDIRFEGVSFAYPTRDDSSVFRELNLIVPAGKVTAVVGSSGCGKSTLAHLLLRFYDPDSGGIYIDGMDIRSLSPKWIRSVIGTVTQEPVLFSCSIRENILYGAAEEQKEVSEEYLWRMCEEANASHFIHTFPHKLETVVGERGVMLSGGQRQRIAIARALFKNPRILLLDEATSALDSESEYLVQEAVERLMRGRTVVTIAHRLSTIKSAHQIAVLAEGKVCELGNYEQLMSLPNGAFKKLVERQTILVDQ